MRIALTLLILSILFSCKEDVKEETFISKSTPISTLFNKADFENPTKQLLLEETGICGRFFEDSTKISTPCSPLFFELYSYSDKIDLKNGFIIQTKANVNGFPARRMVIFAREKGKLVTMNKIVGYLVEKRTTPSGFDDLVVAVVDNVGGYYDRYDVLIRYKNGKYQYEEALGDLQGRFDDQQLKKEATKQVGERIIEHNLFY